MCLKSQSLEVEPSKIGVESGDVQTSPFFAFALFLSRCVSDSYSLKP